MENTAIFLQNILLESAKKNASSVHITVGSVPMMKIDGILAEFEGELIDKATIDGIVSSLLSPEEQEKFAQEKECSCVKEIGGNMRFKMNLYYQKSLPAISFYIIPRQARMLADFDLPRQLSDFLKNPSGLLIVSGPQGSGKTSLCVSMVEEINRDQRKKIITIEDPIEYVFTSRKSIVEQREIGKDSASLFEGLEYSLKEDVDLLYLGEMKEDQISSAFIKVLELASGNAKVIMELNADGHARVLEKLFYYAHKRANEESSRHLIADLLFAIVSLRAYPGVGGGTVLAKEIMLNNPTVVSFIREGKIYQIENIIQTSRREGMVTMERAVSELTEQGKIKQEIL